MKLTVCIMIHIAFTAVALAVSALPVSAELVQTPSPFFDQFSVDLRAMLYGVLQEPADSTQNPGNTFLRLPKYSGILLAQPDIRFDANMLTLSVKPRVRFESDAWTGSDTRGDSSTWDREGYINEWLARVRLRENLFASYGRENLQWGPSFFLSPSNPFFADNGRRAPYLEMPGSDFARLVWIPGGAWTVSLIANMDAGRNTVSGPDPFEKTYAAKIDYMGMENYASLILSRNDRGENTLGLLGGWTVSDALLLYGEGAIQTGSRGLYPETDVSIFGAAMKQTKKDESDLMPILLAGGAYTFEAKGTLTLEYAYNDPGYTDGQAKTYYDLRRSAARSFNSPDAVAGLARMTLDQTADTGLRLLRRHYGLIQYTQNNMLNVLDVILRHTRNFDDGSCQSTGIVTFSPGDHASFFSAATFNSGGGDTEFGSILRYQWTLGVTYTF